jgi:hypothetical protein
LINDKLAPARGAAKTFEPKPCWLVGTWKHQQPSTIARCNCPASNKTSHCSPLSYQPLNPRASAVLVPGEARYFVRQPCRVLAPTSSNPTRCHIIIPCRPPSATNTPALRPPRNHPFDTVTTREASRPRATTLTLVTIHDEGIQTARGRQSPSATFINPRQDTPWLTTSA